MYVYIYIYIHIRVRILTNHKRKRNMCERSFGEAPSAAAPAEESLVLLLGSIIIGN